MSVLSLPQVLICWHELQDSFCESTDLKASWARTMMPLPLLMFLACQEVPLANEQTDPATRIFLHPESKQATSLDMQTARSVADKREFLIWARQI